MAQRVSGCLSSIKLSKNGTPVLVDTESTEMREISSPRRTVSKIGLNKDFIWKHRWVPKFLAAMSWLIFLVALSWRRSELFILLSAGFSLLCSYAWGYSDRVFRGGFIHSLRHLKRKQYAAVWDSLAASRESASVAACGERQEPEIRSSVQNCVCTLRELAQISEHDEVLEIGCGVGRVGKELAPYCKRWTGCDVSAKMLAYAKERLAGIDNTRLVALRHGGLKEFTAESFDVVFATNMLGHLDEIDRWRYVEEAFRVLRPGGRLSIDNIDLESDAGWNMFANDALNFRDVERPPYMPRFSTAGEFISYASRAGFAQVAVHKRSPLIFVSAQKSKSM